MTEFSTSGKENKKSGKPKQYKNSSKIAIEDDIQPPPLTIGKDDKKLESFSLSVIYESTPTIAKGETEVYSPLDGNDEHPYLKVVYDSFTFAPKIRSESEEFD